MQQVAVTPRAAYDSVGRYCQDEVNGFDDETVDRMIEHLDPAGVSRVLDAMAGDGNLSLRLAKYCDARGMTVPDLVVLEYSRVQCEFARTALSGLPAHVVWGDVLTMRDLESELTLEEGSFDRVMIKSANHELPLECHQALYEGVYRVLKPGGSFVNLGFLFDDAAERDEFREIARVKDRFAGMSTAAERRHFPTREETYGRLAKAGFVDVRAAESLDYRIHSAVVARHYFSKAGTEADAEHQAMQAKAFRLRRSGRIRFEGDSSLMILPGEITVARRPTREEENARTFRAYPYDFLRRLECHRELLDKATAWVPASAAVLDLACGPGLFAERLRGKVSSYRGCDLNPDFIGSCRGLVRDSEFTFDVGDMNEVEIGEGRFDAISILNAIYLPGIDAIRVLRKAFAALKPGGRLIVSGPNSAKSYQRIEPLIRAQLERDGLLPEHEEFFRAIGEANAKLLHARGNYWSVEGMLALLGEIGFRAIPGADTGIFYGSGYMVVAERV